MARDVRAGRVGRVVAAGAPRVRYLPIAEHGLIGDPHTVALVGTDATIDWSCCPRFDSPGVFAAILDADNGGLFPDRARRRRLEFEAALSPRHQHSHHALPDARRRGAGAGLHAPAANRRGGAPPPHHPPGRRRARADALRRRRRPALRLRPRPPRDRAHPARRALPLPRAGAQPVGALPAPDRRRPRRPRAHRAPSRGGGHLRARPRRARRGTDAAHRCRHRRRVRRHRGVLAGLAAPLAGARWCTARRSPSNCSPTRPPARSWPPPPPACRSRSAAHATGTTATPGCATPPPRSTRCSGSGLPRRPARSWAGWSSASATRPAASRARCRSCTASTGVRTFPKRNSRTWRATWARRRCGSATARQPSCSSTSTAN